MAKLRHRGPVVNWFAVPVSDVVDPEYEAEVKRTTERAEHEYARAEVRLARAEERLAAALKQQAGSAARKRVAALREVVGQRRTELEEIRKLMTTPAVVADKKIRHRTGLDDHLELGEYKRPQPRHVPPGPVTTSRTGKEAMP
jgi:hypothetical protein